MTPYRRRLDRRLRAAAALSLLALAGSASAAALPPAEGRCGAPICGFSGTSWVEDIVDGEFFVVGEARARWTFDRMEGKYGVYLASGTVTTSWRHEGCSIDVSPASYDFETVAGRSDGELRIDFSTKPWTYSGSGNSSWEGTQVWCPGTPQEHVHEGVLAMWFEGEGTVAARPEAALMGEMDLPYRRSSWRFGAH